MATYRKRLGVLAPKRFVQRLKRDNELFRSFMHQVRIACNPLRQNLRQV